MRKAGTGAALSSHSVRRVSDLLRNLDYPRRLRQNEFAQRYFGDALDADELGARRVRAAVEQALRGLSPRRRSIVERCDFQREPHEIVIRDLAISESYFYRERRNALQSIARELRNAPLATCVRTNRIDLFETALNHATVLAQVGFTDRAIGDLQRVVGEAGEPASKVVALCHSAEISACAGLTGAALSDVAAAERLLNGDLSNDTLLCAQVGAARALALRARGSEAAAERLAAQARRSLLALASSGFDRVRIAEALVICGMVLTEHWGERGDFVAACALADEMAEFANGTDGVRPVIRMRAAVYQVFAHGYPQPNAATIAGLEQLLARSLECGLTAQAGAIAAMLAGVYRRVGRPRAALTNLLPLLDMFRRVPMGEAFAEALLQLAAAYTDIGEAAHAFPFLEEARHVGPAGAYVHGTAFIHEAAVQLSLHDAPRALEAARFAVDYFRRLDRPWHIGVALWLTSLAFNNAGDRANARASIKESVEVLESCGFATIAGAMLTARFHESAGLLATCGQPQLLADVRRAARRTTAGTIATG